MTPEQLSTAVSDERPAQAEGAAVSATSFGIVNDAAWAKLLQQTQADKERPGYRAAVTCYNGQTVSVVSGSQRRFVTDIAPTELGLTKDGAPIVSFTPTLKSVHDGAALQFTPLTTTTGKFVVLDIHTRVNRVQPSDDAKPAIKGRNDQAATIEQLVAAIERPAVTSYQLATTLRVPVDRAILVGGMTFYGDPQGNDPDLYLFVKVAVQELRDDLPTDKPAAKPAAPTLVDPAPQPPSAAAPKGKAKKP